MRLEQREPSFECFTVRTQQCFHSLAGPLGISLGEGPVDATRALLERFPFGAKAMAGVGKARPKTREEGAPGDPQHDVSASGADQLAEFVRPFVVLGIPDALSHDSGEYASCALDQLVIPALHHQLDRADHQELVYFEQRLDKSGIGNSRDPQQMAEDGQIRLLQGKNTRTISATHLDEALQLQLLQYLAGRAPTDAGTAGEVTLRGQAIPGPVTPQQDLLAQRSGDPVLTRHASAGFLPASC